MKRNSTSAERTPIGHYLPTCVVSGGQTGVDRAGLDVAIAVGIMHGGWCPAGRLSEDGSVPSRYQLRETETSEYPPRTEQNVIDSDATLILFEKELKGGTRLTRRFCRRHNKPHLVVRIDPPCPDEVLQWLNREQPATLNIAGPRESTYPGIYDRAFQFLIKIFGH
ncbi:MAG: putative molybdenum carrier protein [Rubripirellula sp.]|nr:putative molybdenum carrier protein [Rubripirellula sp.]